MEVESVERTIALKILPWRWNDHKFYNSHSSYSRDASNQKMVTIGIVVFMKKLKNVNLLTDDVQRTTTDEDQWQKVT